MFKPQKIEIINCITRNLQDANFDPNWLTKNLEDSDIFEDMYALFGIELPEEKVKESKDTPVTYSTIKKTVGWNQFCNITGHNHYAINEWGDYDTSHVFYITETQFKELWN